MAHALKMADILCRLLEEHEWHVVNSSTLAVVCFVDARGSADPAEAAGDVVADGRACITSHCIQEEYLHALVDSLDQVRST